MNPQLLWLIPTLPFAGFLLNGTLGRKLPRAAVAAVALLTTLGSAFIVAGLWTVLKDTTVPIKVCAGDWIASGAFHVPLSFTVDHLTLLMLSVITGVGFLIHVYSVGYMAHEEGYWRFFAYLNLFMFFMLVLVLASNFLLLFVGWEGVGLASYLLIGFYFTKDSAANAGKKAFIVNRIGDFGFVLAMFLLVAHFGTLNFADIFARSATVAAPMTAICLLLVLGATGKSAQIPLYIWLPDAMEGPTPVSALIHAATMVTAGIYLIARCHALFALAPVALNTVTIIGALTAILAATIGITQHDIKRVLAYSTVSQLGYMVMACGVGATTAGIFHLMTHAFFKALLFLSAGSVIHALNGEQDMRRMGGLRTKIPVTFWCMTVGVFAIAGLPGLSGFFSKDEILAAAFNAGTGIGKFAWAVGVITATITSFYMFRLWFKTFFGAPRSDQHHPHESPLVMTVPLMILAVLSIIGGLVGVPAFLGGHNEIGHFLAPVLSSGTEVTAAPESAALAYGLLTIAVAAFALGLLAAWWLYAKNPGRAGKFADRMKPLYSLVNHKYWVDEIYGLLIVTPVLAASRVLLNGLVDSGIIQGTPSVGASATGGVASIVRRMQSGNIRSYAGWLALGAAAVIAVTVFGMGAHLR